MSKIVISLALNLPTPVVPSYGSGMMAVGVFGGPLCFSNKPSYCVKKAKGGYKKKSVKKLSKAERTRLNTIQVAAIARRSVIDLTGDDVIDLTSD